MLLRSIALVVFAAAGTCNTPPPNPVPPDADAAPSPPPPAADASTSCSSACATLSRLCAPQRYDCPAVLQRANDDRLVRSPSGAPMTCACIAAATSAAEVTACGASCK